MNDSQVEPNGSKWLVYTYFAAVMLFSIPFWLGGFMTGWELLPGVPISAAMFLLPGVVAFVFAARLDGRVRAMQWIKEVSRLSSAKRGGWIAVAIALPPAAMFAAYVGMLLAGYEIPEPELSVVGAITLLAVFFIPAAFEELGWSCFALVILQRRMSALGASLVVGTIWALWHVIPLMQADRAVEWIAWWSLTTVALRVLITWLFNNTSRTLIPVTLFHASENMAWQSFPVRGSHYEPAIHAVCLWVICAVVVVSFGWKTLSGKRNY